MKNKIYNSLVFLETNNLPTINDVQVIDTIRNSISPVVNILMVVLPLSFFLAILITGISHFSKDEREREQKPIGSSIKVLLVGYLILQIIIVIVKVWVGF